MKNPETNLESNPEPEISFSDHLIESAISPVHQGRGKLFEIKGNPDKIVRMESFEDLEQRYKHDVDPVVIAEEGQKLYAELEKKYDIAVPVEFLVGKDSKDNDVIYAIVDKIDGSDLDKIEVTPELTEKVEQLYEAIAQYYLDTVTAGEGIYLADINDASQYVYGKKKGDENPQIYLVDTDLYMRDGPVALRNVILWLYRHMCSVEKKYGKKFIRAREIIRQTIAQPLPETVTDEQKTVAKKIIEKTKGYMDGSVRMDDDDAHPIFSNMD